MMTFKLTVLAPERKLIEGFEVESVQLTGSEGQIEILPCHAGMVGSLETGPFIYKAKDGGVEMGVISHGFFQMRDNELTVLADTLELKSEIDISRAKSAQDKAKKILSDASIDEHQFKKYQLKLERALIRQQIAGQR
jgi:F-type H+-transporting ATPase subunit epsilon